MAADSLFIVALRLGVRVCSMFCCAVLFIFSSFAIILKGKRETRKRIRKEPKP